MKRILKTLLFGSGRTERHIPFGLYAGLTLSIDSSSEINLWLGTYEAETTPYLRRAGKQARTLIDVGSGNGELTIWGLKQPFMEHVLAYDPKPERWPVFRENLALNNLANDRRLMACEDCFLGDDDSESVVQLFENLPEPILIKIDVDGGEEVILRRMKQVLKNKRLMFLIETHSQELDHACYDLLESAGYAVKRIKPAWWRMLNPERRPLEFNQWLAANQIRS